MTSSRHHRRRLVVLALTCSMVAGAGAATASGTVAGDGDPLQAPECRAAIAALQAREADEIARVGGASAGHAPSAELLAARRDAARRCLASRADPPVPPGRPIQPPIVVAPIAMPMPMPMPMPMQTQTQTQAGTIARRAPAIAPARAPIPGPRTVTSCDAGGCWTSDGTRVDRFGSNLWGRRGVCTLSGTVLQCP